MGGCVRWGDRGVCVCVCGGCVFVCGLVVG